MSYIKIFKGKNRPWLIPVWEKNGTDLKYKHFFVGGGGEVQNIIDFPFLLASFSFEGSCIIFIDTSKGISN